MKPAALSLLFALAAGPALASPFSDALAASDGALCFTRSYDAAWLKAHRGQTVREVRLSFVNEASLDGPVLRLSLQGANRLTLIFGVCGWMEGDINRGVANNILDPSFTPMSGINCWVMTDTTGASAEEGGNFPIDWADGQTLEIHLPEMVAGWPGYDTRRGARWPTIKPQDRIMRVMRADASACAELRAKFAPAKP